MPRIGLYTIFTVKPGQRDALVALLLEAARGMEALPGCELYLITTVPDDEEVVWVTEVWRSMEEHDASLTLPGSAELIQRARPLLSAPPERIDVVPVGGKGLA